MSFLIQILVRLARLTVSLSVNAFLFKGALKAKKSDGTSKLPFILKPTSEECPTFEVEELPDGKLTIIPIGPKAAKAKNLIAKKTQPMDFAQFQNSLSAGYFAMLHVFRYLNTNDRMKASRVCKLWYQISKDQSLWQNVAVKDCRVRSWTVLRDQCNRNCTKRLDLKKMPLETDDNTLWSGFNGNFINAVTTLTSLELPKISAPSLHSVVKTAIDSPITQLKGKKIFFRKERESLTFDIFSHQRFQRHGDR